MLAFWSGILATIAGVLLAMVIPIRRTPGTPEASPATPPLYRLEQALHMSVAFLIVPSFGFANAGVSFAGLTPAVLVEPLSLGVAGGLDIGNLVGVFCTVFLLVRAGWTDLPVAASWPQVFGVACSVVSASP